MIEALLIALVVLFVGSLFLGSPVGPSSSADQSPHRSDQNPADLADQDPVEALLRHGTSDDAARLMGQGIDLETLGYRPPNNDQP